MNWKRSLTLLLLAAGLVAGGFNVRPITRSTNAQSTTSSSESWEYCTIEFTNVHIPAGGLYVGICYFQSSGCRRSSIEGDPLDHERDVVIKAAAILGQDGWEMIGDFPTPGVYYQPKIYFKRRLLTK